MKIIKNTLLVVGLLLGVSGSSAKSDQARMLERIAAEVAAEEAEGKSDSSWESKWLSKGPTERNIKASGHFIETEVENLDTKGGLEDNLISAAKKGDLKSVENLIAGGANVNDKDSFDWTALEYAVSGGDTEIVKLLIANGAAAENDKRLEEFFVAAVFNGNNEMVKALLALDISFSSDALTSADSYAQITCSAEVRNAIKELQKKKILIV